MKLMAHTIGVDLGGTNLRVAAYTQEGGLLETVARPTRVHDGPAAVVADTCGAVHQLRERYTAAGPLAGIGVGSPGPLELPRGRFRQPPNLPGWDGFELRAALEHALGMPIFLENDANVAALAECQLGAGKTLGTNSLCMLTLGTGVGGGIILHGKIWDGKSGMAGEVGHLNIWTDGAGCGCGSHGCLEAYASATAARRMAEELIAAGTAPGLAALQKQCPEFTARDIAELASAGDAGAKKVFANVGQALGIGLASLVNTLNLPLYVLGGGLAESWHLFAPTLFVELQDRSYVYRLTQGETGEANAPQAGRTMIVRAELGPDAGLLGACILPFAAANREAAE
jgi:glucokinase